MSVKSDIRDKLYVKNEYGYEHQNLYAKLDKDDVKWLQEVYGIRTKFVYDKETVLGQYPEEPDELSHVTDEEYELQLTDYAHREEQAAKIRAHSMCLNCQARQVIKYEGWKDRKDVEIKGFNVRCDFVPFGTPPGSKKLLERYITEHDLDRQDALRYLRSAVDPAAWCEVMFGFRSKNSKWRLRPYQKEQLRCSSKRMVVREGRRSGKTFAMALKILYLAFNKLKDKGLDSYGKSIKEGPEILIITPYQSQISNIFNEMEKLLKRNRDLSADVRTGTGGGLYVKTPFFRMEFANGAKISGFVSGVGNKDDGSGGGTMRGQNADVIYLDEMDMIPEEILDKVIIPILLTNDSVQMIATSTPIGKRGRFYEWCLNRPDFKEDYFPSSVLPHWNKIKNEIEAENTKDGFAAEYMAHFIESSYGVFKPSLILRARGAWSYKDANYYNTDWWRGVAGVHERADLIKVIGIDWNKNAGSEFVVVAYDPNQHHWFVVEAVNIEPGEYGSVSFKQEVIRLNFKWKPDYIYADAGYGHHIIEDLHWEAHRLKCQKNKNVEEIQTAKLGERLKAFDFSKKVKFRSPIDHTTFEKVGKEFLVENAVRVFEQESIWFPEDDQVLYKQLMHYVVLRMTPTTNKKIYGADSEAIGDHRLDALMLALGGLFLEKSMYTANNSLMSVPSMLTRDTLEQRADNLRRTAMGAADILRQVGEHAPALQPELLSIRRAGTAEEEDRLRQIAKAEEDMKKHSTPGWFKRRVRHRRSDLGREKEEPSSLLAAMWERAHSNSSAGYADDTEALHRMRELSKLGTSSVVQKPRRAKRKFTKR